MLVVQWPDSGDIHYILRQTRSRQESLSSLRKLRLLLKIIPVDEKAVDLALASDFEDFEDAIQYYAALERNLEALITRNKKDFRKSKIPVYTAEEFLTRI